MALISSLGFQIYLAQLTCNFLILALFEEWFTPLDISLRSLSFKL
jgi:hypothetical protein